MLIVLVLFLAVAAVAVIGFFRDKRRQERTAKALGLDGPNVRVVDCEGPMFRFAVKWEEKVAYAVNDVNAPPIRIPLEEIADCEFTGGGGGSEGIGRAVGRFVVGGAVADAMDGSLRGTSLRIYTKERERSMVEYRLRRSTYLPDFRRFAKEVSALVEEIAADNEAE